MAYRRSRGLQLVVSLVALRHCHWHCPPAGSQGWRCHQWGHLRYGIMMNIFFGLKNKMSLTARRTVPLPVDSPSATAGPARPGRADSDFSSCCLVTKKHNSLPRLAVGHGSNKRLLIKKKRVALDTKLQSSHEIVSHAASRITKVLIRAS